MGINDEKLKEDFVDFAVGLRRFPALPVMYGAKHCGYLLNIHLANMAP